MAPATAPTCPLDDSAVGLVDIVATIDLSTEVSLDERIVHALQPACREVVAYSVVVAVVVGRLRPPGRDAAAHSSSVAVSSANRLAGSCSAYCRNTSVHFYMEV